MAVSHVNENALYIWVIDQACWVKMAGYWPIIIIIIFFFACLCVEVHSGVLSHIINPSLTKLVRSRWQDIGRVLFLRVYVLRSINTQKENEANIQPS